MSSPLLKVRGLSKQFRVERGLFSDGRLLRAVDRIDLDVARGETVGLVGESGSGKTTAGRTLLRLYEPDEGSIEFDGIDLLALNAREMRRMRRRMQIVFQDPGAALNPRLKVGTLVGEPLQVHGLARGVELRRKVGELLEEVGLDAAAAQRYPGDFSGGQKQRIFIARALSMRPDFVVLDEPVSALDLSVQAQVVNLLVELQQRHQLAYLFIAHDLALVSHLCDRIVVIYLGRIVESGSSDELRARPRHPYTRALFASSPPPVPALARLVRAPIPGEIPSPLDPPSGCRFHPRCPLAIDRCRSEVPELRAQGGTQAAACHRAEEVAELPWPATGRPPESTARGG